MSAPRLLRERPAEWTARLGRSLRSAGLPVGLTESLAAAQALRELDREDAIDVYFGLRSVFAHAAGDLPAFDRCFHELWRGEAGPPRRPPGAGPGGERPAAEPRAAPPAEQGGEPLQTQGADSDSPHHGWEPTGPDDPGPHGGGRVGAAYSAREVLARRSFGSLGEREVREVDGVLDRLLVRLATRRSRRLRAGGRRGPLDFRRTLGGAVRHDAELIRLARRQRRLDRPRVVLLCDVSGSMARYSRFLLRFLLAALRRDRVEAFAFGTRLTRLGPELRGMGTERALAALGSRVQDWSGGTRIGACLEEFLERHGRALLGQRTVVVILSDGLDRGGAEALVRAMRGIRRRARRVVWLNPLLESPAYAPEARGMKAALPFVDDFAPGYSLASLREAARLIRL